MKSLLIGIPITLLLFFVIYNFGELMAAVFVLGCGFAMAYFIGETVIMIWEKWRGK